jgi:hypothetical protein
MRLPLLFLLAASLSACPPKPITEVTLSGTVFDGPDSIDGVPDASIEVRNVEGTLFDTATADASGSFSVTAPPGEPVFMVTNGFDHVPTSFTFNTGSVDVDIPKNVVWARRAPILDELHAAFEGCDNATAARTSIEGEVRLYLGDVTEVDELPIVNTALLYIDNGDGTLDAACYLGDDGQSDPEATITGATGRYALFDVAEGPRILTVTYDADGVSVTTELLVYVPDGGTVPIYPTFVPIP